MAKSRRSRRTRRAKSVKMYYNDDTWSIVITVLALFIFVFAAYTLSGKAHQATVTNPVKVTLSPTPKPVVKTVKTATPKPVVKTAK